jgi:hypothetical protein
MFAQIQERGGRGHQPLIVAAGAGQVKFRGDYFHRESVVRAPHVIHGTHFPRASLYTGFVTFRVDAKVSETFAGRKLAEA